MDRWIVCLKHGRKYTSDYVNTLYNMAKRHSTVEFKFACFTEDASGIHPDIHIFPLPDTQGVKGWWYKPYFFNPELPVTGTILYFDLDVIIFRNIDYLWTYEPESFCIIRDFNRCSVPSWNRMNSSIFRINTGQHSHVWKDFVKDPSVGIKRMHGDQDWIFFKTKDKSYKFWPDEWIQSYKWEMRKKPAMARDKQGVRNFMTAGEPEILPTTSVAVFHGDPNPHNCIDPWCKENWK
jgi:hypothetical protein